ncbi:MAG: ABC transporter ATP-binding protein [Desulfuromonadaceae bacterium]|nr:ABC transporter ATP-binding protein [Desulfuromonadaceae bacterium]
MNSASVAAPQILLQACGISKTFHTAHGPVDVLHELDLRIEQGERIAIVGASGSGKTTLMHILGTLDRPTTGRCLFQGRDLFALGAAQLDGFRNRSLGFVFQFHQLLPEFTALENVMMPALIARQPRTTATARADELLQQVGLGHRMQHKPGQLSGGEQQRVAIARALVLRPQLLIADEPTGNLDSATSQEIYQLLDELHADYRLTMVVVTHNAEFATRMDRVLRIADGRIETCSK